MRFKNIALTSMSVLIISLTSTVTHAGQTKVYKVPGSAVIGYTKTHGYKFFTGKKIRISPFPTTNNCGFMGMHYLIPARSKCKVTGFKPSKRSCRRLTNGWKVKKITLKGNYVWEREPKNSNRPTFVVMAKNASTKAKPLLIKWVELVGPVGPANNWTKAFRPCHR